MGYSEYDVKVLPTVLAAIILVSVILAVALRRRNKRIRAIPTALIAVTMLFIEIVKQRWNFLGDQDPYILPFHYCSIFLLIIPLAELCGQRLSGIFRPIAACMAFSVSAGMYLFPQGILGNACETFGVSFYRTHSFIFHHLLVLYFVLVVAMRLYEPRFRSVFIVGGVGLTYGIIATPIAHALNENYCNLLESAIPPMEELRISYGQVSYTVILVVCLILGTMLGSALYVASSKFFMRFVFTRGKNQKYKGN